MRKELVQPWLAAIDTHNRCSRKIVERSLFDNRIVTDGGVFPLTSSCQFAKLLHPSLADDEIGRV